MIDNIDNDESISHHLFMSLYRTLGLVNITYMSTPITSGRLYLDIALSSARVISEKEKTAIRNHYIDRAMRMAARLRLSYAVLVNPAALVDIPDWTQVDYIVFWTSVINEFANCSIFLNDWHYSRGCVQEFVTCVRKGIPTLDEDCHNISIEAALRLLEKAIDDYRLADMECGVHETMRKELMSI